MKDLNRKCRNLKLGRNRTGSLDGKPGIRRFGLRGRKLGDKPIDSFQGKDKMYSYSLHIELSYIAGN